MICINYQRSKYDFASTINVVNMILHQLSM